jgi:CubicO group peptidase (beta-lactamase class C family)
VQSGFISSLDDPVTRYIRGLCGSAYDDVTVRQLLTMTSGVRWKEDYNDANSDIARFYEDPVTPGLDATVSYMRRLPRESPPGATWHYSTGETHLLGVLVATATGQSLADYLAATIWKPYGMERPASWSTDRTGHELAGCCLQASLRDFARFGQFVLDDGMVGGRRVVPAGWFAAATRTQVATPYPGRGYGYQWWTADDGTFDAIGIHGQRIHIDPARRVVVVLSCSWPEVTSPERSAAQRRMLERLAGLLDAESARRR